MQYSNTKTVFDYISKQQELKIQRVARRGVLLMNFKVFGNGVKHCLACLINSIFFHVLEEK